jgi:hypothetical protein
MLKSKKFPNNPKKKYSNIKINGKILTIINKNQIKKSFKNKKKVQNKLMKNKFRFRNNQNNQNNQNK